MKYQNSFARSVPCSTAPSPPRRGPGFPFLSFPLSLSPSRAIVLEGLFFLQSERAVLVPIVPFAQHA